MGGTMNGTEICTVLGTPGATASYSAPVKDGMYFTVGIRTPRLRKNAVRLHSRRIRTA